MAESTPPKRSPLRSGLTLRCPGCGEGKLFSGYLHITETCSYCGEELTNADPGDGPAVFVILVVGSLVVGSAVYVEVSYSPPYWVHAMIWLPAILILSFGLLPLFKSLFFASHYANQAGEYTRGPEQ